jgi:hypothetical protein
MPVESPELDDSTRETTRRILHEIYQLADAGGPCLEPRTRPDERGLTITLRLKRDRRSVVTHVAAEHERRRR